ncbi:MAG: hypothetical protein ACRBI6_10025 [Acidimicrobiales bacterium]
MKKFLVGAIGGAALMVVVALWTGVASVGLPWIEVPEFTDVDVALELPEAARIVGIEQIALDCRARIHAEVPVEGRRDHSAFGQTYRTDTVTLEAIGDVDTCVEGTSAEVVYHRDGTTEVIIPGESIVFVRPRVDAVATADSVEVNKGLVGRFTDVFPWVDTDLGLTPLAYAYAQTVIGSSSCMEAAYTATEDVLIDAYRQQFVEAGADPDDLVVRIEGEPLFSELPSVDLGDVEMTAATEGTCLLAEGLGGGVTQIDR